MTYSDDPNISYPGLDELGENWHPRHDPFSLYAGVVQLQLWSERYDEPIGNVVILSKDGMAHILAFASGDDWNDRVDPERVAAWLAKWAPQAEERRGRLDPRQASF